MTNNKGTASPARVARMAGLWWLLFIIIGPVSYLAVDGKLLVQDDTAKTLENIHSNTALFWIGAAAFFAGYACFILLAKSLCKLFKPVYSKLTKFMMGIVIAGTALVVTGKAAEIAAVNIKNAACLFNLRTNIEMAGELFWGIWLVSLVILIFKSNLIPKAVGGAVALAAVYHLAVFCAFFITGTDISTNPVLTFLGLGEFAIALWLLIRGVRTSKTQD